MDGYVLDMEVSNNFESMALCKYSVYESKFILAFYRCRYDERSKIWPTFCRYNWRIGHFFNFFIRLDNFIVSFGRLELSWSYYVACCYHVIYLQFN